MIEVGIDCICVTSFEEWTPRPPTFDAVPMIHEVVTVAAVKTDEGGAVWVRLRAPYTREFSIEAFRQITGDEQSKAASAVVQVLRQRL